MTEDNSIPIAALLDERHSVAQAAFARRDVDAYREIFSASLRYRQADGNVIGRDALMRDVAAQFRRLSAARSSFQREALSAAGKEATETLVQLATAETTAFGVIHRRWQVKRRARYHWVDQAGIWRIEAAEVFSEAVTPAGWLLGRAEPPPA